MVVPMERMHKAAFYHPFAEAAYTVWQQDISIWLDYNSVYFDVEWSIAGSITWYRKKSYAFFLFMAL